MKNKLVYFFAFLVLILFPVFIFAQQDETFIQKYALVIGNGAYTNLSRLANPVNDANDMASALQGMGFTVEKLLNASQQQMDEAVMRLKNRLSVSRDSYGFFFYAGHGVQAAGENYLIPVDANIPGENYLRSRAVPVQIILDELNESKNILNMVILDACRDNPFGWSRSGSRGLAIVARQPVGSIIVYATSAGQQASDGIGRNGLFTSQFLPNLTTPGLEVNEVFRRTGADVSRLSDLQQVPAIYNQFFGVAYLTGLPGTAINSPELIRPEPQPFPVSSNKNERTPKDPSQLWTVGASVGSSFGEPWFIATARGTVAPINNIFFELGFDIGLVSGISDLGYNSFLPYANAAYFLPFSDKMGAYAGIGGGYLMANYVFTEEGSISKNSFLADIILGMNLFNMIDISYSFRTNFNWAGSKISAGYVYRF